MASSCKALGLDIDLAAGGLGLRSKRFSMIVDDGKVTSLNIENAPGQAMSRVQPSCSSSLTLRVQRKPRPERPAAAAASKR